MNAECDVPVIIAGAGPVGLTLAADLGWRGVSSLVVDPQIEVNVHPRAISIGVRSMEHFRRLGLDQKIINAGVPRSHPLDVVYVTQMASTEIFRFRIPSIDDLEQRGQVLAQAIPEVAASPYYKTWVAQSGLERVLRAHLQPDSHAETRMGWRLESFVDEESRVIARLTESASGRSQTVSSGYLVGCDGAASTVRRGLGVRLAGKGTLGVALGVYFRAPGLRKMLPHEPAVMYWILAPGCTGVIYTIDGGDDWVFNRYYAAAESAATVDPRSLLRAALGSELTFEILSVQEWKPRQLVAESFGRRRVFLAGDACHLFVPTGGFGMNTGIGDAADLAWKIAAMIEGWGGRNLLATYDTERRPVGTYNTLEAADNYAKSGDIFSCLDGLQEEGSAGETARNALLAMLPPKIKHFAPIGVHLGYMYENSPIVIPDGTPSPSRDIAAYTPTARPGHRAPHVWLAPGVSILDLFGNGFTLLCFDKAGNVDRLVSAARGLGVPLSVRRISDTKASELYGRRLVLVRPDGHVAWRADNLPRDPRALLNAVRGESPVSAESCEIYN
jgi:2-polyprenyl-6-methoxyphenol hydroxylase-like FAD-dependent oxidoreductase